MTSHEILIAAKALIPDEEHWWRGKTRRQPNQHCLLLAIHHVCEGDEDEMETRARYAEAAGISKGGIARWNDAPERTLAEVHAAFDRAIAATRPTQDEGER